METNPNKCAPYCCNKNLILVDCNERKRKYECVECETTYLVRGRERSRKNPLRVQEVRPKCSA